MAVANILSQLISSPTRVGMGIWGLGREGEITGKTCRIRQRLELVKWIGKVREWDSVQGNYGLSGFGRDLSPTPYTFLKIYTERFSNVPTGSFKFHCKCTVYHPTDQDQRKFNAKKSLLKENHSIPLVLTFLCCNTFSNKYNCFN